MSVQKFVCPHCSVEYYSKRESFKRHVKYCYKNPDLEYLFCELCSQKFARPDNYKNHLAKHHTVEEKPPIEEYSDEIPFDDLFIVKQSEIRSESPQFLETIFIIDFTEKAIRLIDDGNFLKLMARAIDHVIKTCNVRDSDQLCQISIENKVLSYPITTGLQKGAFFDANHLFDRFEKVSQSNRLFEHDRDLPEITMRVFQRDIPKE
jgi:hypothetical protein